MPTGIARYWDSLESDEYFEPCQSHTGSAQKLDDCQKQWLSELSVTAENECQSILYAKSLLDDVEESAPVVQEVPPIQVNHQSSIKKKWVFDYYFCFENP
ncbi:unnamed protein product [Strongylus vulgaris]|uniref:Uncharacterized protein n=1 Tax=Strongylus vulgaris TaxID=40348 RepID=A0A3P7J2A8_STRVU|nr:unnamed protein product [Strongylus vulgaris]